MRILFVAMPQSVHTARWINQLAGRGWDLHLFPSMLESPHPDLRDVTIYGVSARRPAQLHPSVRWRGLSPLRTGASLLAQRLRAQLPMALAWLVRRLKPDLVHSLEIQHAGYLAFDARSRLGGAFPPWAVTNWGSDIYLFGRFAVHRDRIKAVMAACDYYACECERDVELARRFGFTGTRLLVAPNAGGLRLGECQRLREPGPTSSRRLIVLKGYQTWAGRALVGLRAIEMSAELLRGYRVAVYLATPDVALAAELVTESTGVPLDILPQVSHEEMLRLHGRARASIGLSISDGASQSMLEAMAMGSFPIQSDNGCQHEWVDHGTTGMLVPPNDPASVAGALRRALTDDRLVEEAAAANLALMGQRYDYGHVQDQVLAAYAGIAREARDWSPQRRARRLRRTPPPSPLSMPDIFALRAKTERPQATTAEADQR